MCLIKISYFAILSGGYLHPISLIVFKSLQASIFLITSCFLISATGCTGKATHILDEDKTITLSMDIEEARKFLIKFKNSEAPPPRKALDETLQWYVNYYSHQPIFPANPGHYSRKWSLDQLEEKAIHLGRYASPQFYMWANREFYQGQVGLAISLLKIATKHKRISLDNLQFKINTRLSRYLAESGNHIEAEKLLATVTEPLINSESIYMYSISKAAIEFSKGNASTAAQYYKRAISVPAWDYKTAIDNRSLGGMQESIFGNHNRFMSDGMIGLSKSYLWLGQLQLAEIWAREALEFRSFDNISHILITLTDVYLAQGRFEDAEMIAETALKSVLKNKNLPRDSFIRALTRESLAKVYTLRGNWEGAILQFEALKEDLKTDTSTFSSRFENSREWGLSLHMAKRHNDAKLKFDAVFDDSRSKLGLNHYNTAEAEGCLGMVHKSINSTDKALRNFRNAVPILLTHWRQSDGKQDSLSSRGTKLKFIIDSYVDTLLTKASSSVDTENAQALSVEAFTSASAFLTRSVHRSLASNAVRFVSEDPQLISLIRQSQDIHRQISIRIRLLKDSMAYYEDPSTREKIVNNLKREIKNLEIASDRYQLEIKNRFPRYDAIINPKLISINRLRQVMRENEALIFIFVGEKNTYLWSIRKNGLIAYSKASIGEEDLSEKISKIRKSLDLRNVQTLQDIPEFNTNVAYDLYDILLRPIENGWKDFENLLFVSSGSLGQIPLSLLPLTKPTLDKGDSFLFSKYKDVNWLIKSHSITMLPSVASLITLRSNKRSQKPSKNFIGFGDPIYNIKQTDNVKTVSLKSQTVSNSNVNIRGIRVLQEGHLDDATITSAHLEKLNRLPDTADEINNVAAILNANFSEDVYLAERATEKNVKTVDLSKAKILAFASHALVPGDLDGLYQPAIALTSPTITGDDEDGLLTMSEIMGLKCNANLIILSGCNTGAASGSGVESFSGLGRAFFYAGTQAILASMWPVESTSAKKLTTETFRIWKTNSNLSIPNALRESMLNLINSGRLMGEDNNVAIASYAHPIFWAPFVIVGDGS